MNRHLTAVQCVKALAAQTNPPAIVVVADNRSNDDTAGILETLTELPFALHVLRLDENLGNAGGIEAAMDLAFKEGADAVWILDDDSWPRPECLAALLEEEWDLNSVRHALQIDPTTGRFTWPMPIRTSDSNSQLIWSEKELPKMTRIETTSSWTGALIPKAIYQKVGPVMAELFIRGEDEEYPMRIANMGFRFYAYSKAIMDHPGPQNLKEWHIFNNFIFDKHFFYEAGLVEWKVYYKVRNMVWLMNKRSGVSKGLMISLAYLLAVLRYDGMEKLPITCKAILHGWQGRLGRMT